MRTRSGISLEIDNNDCRQNHTSSHLIFKNNRNIINVTHQNNPSNQTTKSRPLSNSVVRLRNVFVVSLSPSGLAMTVTFAPAILAAEEFHRQLAEDAETAGAVGSHSPNQNNPWIMLLQLWPSNNMRTEFIRDAVNSKAHCFRHTSAMFVGVFCGVFAVEVSEVLWGFFFFQDSVCAG